MARVLESIIENFIGLDLGQRHDYTTLAVVERAELLFDVRDPVTYECKRETRFAVRYLERIRLRTPYPDVVERVREVAMDACLGTRRSLVVDATGVGRPVMDLLRIAKIDCPILAVGIIGNGSPSVGQNDVERTVLKRDLITGLQLLFDRRELQIAHGLPETEILMKELMSMRVKMSASGHDSYGNGPGSAHDDLVLAVALACWRAKEPNRWNWFGGRPG